MGSSCSSLLKRNSGISEPDGNELLVSHEAEEVVPARATMIKATETLGPPSLTQCAILSIARNMDSLQSLRGVPQELVQQLFAALVSNRLLTHNHLPLLVSVIDARLPSYPCINDDWLAYMGSLFTNLTRLDLSNCMECTDEGAKCLTGLNYLKSLSVDRCLRLGDASLQSFGRLTSLCTLSVSACTRMASPGVACLSSLTRMTDLSLEQLARLDFTGLEAITNLSNLRSLNLAWTHSTGATPAISWKLNMNSDTKP
jgi:hypothetical protein